MNRRPALGLLLALFVALGSLATAPAAVAVDRDCSDFASQRAAQIFFLNHGGPNSDPHRLDSDSDGIACESNPAPYYYGTTPPGGGGSDPQPEITSVKSQVYLNLNPSKRIAGESFKVKVSVRPAISRKVVIQRKANGRWKPSATGTTGGDGKTSGVLRAPKADVHYRAVLKPVTKGNKKYSAATSKTRTLDVQRQRVVLNFDEDAVAEGDRARAFVRARPVRAGRKVVLQMRSEGRWRTLETGRFDRRGRATFTITPELGRNSYRAVALRHRGAAAKKSDRERLSVIDETPPPAPYDLVATPGDAAVQLSWSRVAPADFDHHEVWMRTADSTWALVSVTESSSIQVTQLENGVAYWFTVTSVDTSGNASTMATEVTATPTAPSLVE